MARRTRPIEASATALTISTMTSAAIRWPADPLVSRSAFRSSAASEKSSIRSRSSACTALPANESITPAVTAVAGGTPWHWKKRTLIAIRAIDEGSARFMKPVASCIRYTGR